jgi:DNA polymerase-3 subunit beta
MRFITSSGTLLRQLQILSGAVGTGNNATPIVENFLFEVKGDVMKITASDLETTMRSTTEVESEQDGLIAVPAKMLMETLKSLPEMPVTFSLDSASLQLEISSEYGKYAIACLPGDTFPDLTELENPSKISMPAEKLQKALSQTIFAAANDEMRPVVSGVFFQITSDAATFVATDAHKLVRFMVVGLENEQTGGFVMPKKPLNILKSILGQAESHVNILYTASNVRFEFDEVTLVTRLVEGRYPNYEAVIPNDSPFHLIIDRASFLSSIKRVSIFSNKSSNQIRMKISGTEIHISTEDLDYSSKANERLHCSYEGEDLTMGFSAKFLIEVLSNLDAKEVRMELSAPNRAGLLFPIDGIEVDEDLLMLVMPVMVSSAD